ncbi:MAG: zinc ribbon domain-containing protein [Phycisphaerales bacterium]|nr:zinc ribbon domain-containing protein [Phycisphaerales bacterium]MCB9858640.1 zinc ribbon domain-containing protein [Phycisphaerales bacterium]
MGNDGICGECGANNVPVAHFCSQCGQPLDASPRTVGRTPHPVPANVPEGYRKCDRAADLHFKVGSAWGGTRLLGTENLGITVFNAGYGLEQVEIRVTGQNSEGRDVFEFRQVLASVPRRAELSFEVPSYEISEPPSDVRVELISAVYSR